jgi:hypothetical protein
MSKLFDANYKDTGNILIERLAAERTAYVQCEIQMLVSFLTTLALVLPVTFNMLNHLNVLASDSHEMVELKNHACMILNKKFTTYKLNMAASFLCPNYHQLKNASNPRARKYNAGCVT